MCALATATTSARHARVTKLVYAASSSCYGLAATPTREDHPIDAQHPTKSRRGRQSGM